MNSSAPLFSCSNIEVSDLHLYRIVPNPIISKHLFIMMAIKVPWRLYLSLSVCYFFEPPVDTEKCKLQHLNKDSFVPRDMES